MGQKKEQKKYKSSRKNILKREKLIQSNHKFIKQIVESLETK